MRPTRRALAVMGLCALSIGLALRFGARSLGALLVPMVVALVAGGLQVWRTGRPTLRRSQPGSGFPGETRTVELTVESEGETRASVTDTIGDGLDGRLPRAEITLPTSVEYDVELRERGEARLGPATVRVTDVLGLFSCEYRYARLTSVLVYPEVRSLARPVREVAGVEAASDERRAFDRLREYVPGDSPRDIHWKSSAKRDDLVVMEFAAEDPEDSVAVAAESAPGHADAMATATASVVLEALDAGLTVELTLPDARVRPRGGPAGRDRLLEALARTTGGPIDDDRRAAADVVVTADGHGARVLADGRTRRFEELVGETDDTAKGRRAGNGPAHAGNGRGSAGRERTGRDRAADGSRRHTGADGTHGTGGSNSKDAGQYAKGVRS